MWADKGGTGVIAEDRARSRRKPLTPSTPPSLSAAFDRAPSSSYDKGEVVVYDGQPLKAWHVVRQGWAWRTRSVGRGHVAVLEIYVPGDVIGPEAEFDKAVEDSVVALTPLTVGSVAAAQVRKLTSSVAGKQYLAWHLDQKRRWAEKLALSIHLDARQKIAMLVLDLYGRLRRGKSVSGNTYVLPLTQQQIGDSLGLTSIHVNRTLGELRRHGIVRLERSVVTILDPNMLTRLADGRQA
jgi:CRP-like cAMP-binding protein